MSTLLSQILELKSQISFLEAKVKSLESESELVKSRTPFSVVGGVRDRSHSRPVDPSTGLGNTFGGNMTWNDSDTKLPPWGTGRPNSPTKGYSKHFHSRYSGGAFDIGIIELVKFDTNWETDPARNPHCQHLFKTEPKVETDDNGEEKISTLEGLNNTNTDKPNLVWDKESKCWRFYAVYAKDIEVGG